SIQNVSQKIVFNLRSVVFNRILSLSLKQTNETKKGELLSVVMNDVNVLSSSVASGIIVFVTDIITLIGLTLVMIFLDVILTLIALLIALIIVFSSRRYRKKVRGTWLNERESVAQLSSNVEETLSGIRVVKALAVESKKKEDFLKLNIKNFDITMKGTQLSASFSALISIITTLLIVSVIFIGGILFYFGNISLGDFIIFYLYTTLFIQPIKGLSGIYTTFQIAVIAIKHITKYLEKPNDIPEPENPIPLPIPFNGRVEYKNVSFSYTNEPFIENLNFIINSGEQIGIVGEMGAGKTTLIKAIADQLDIEDNVHSPTFSIVNEYGNVRNEVFYHFDFYRIKNETEAMDIGIEEYFDSGDLCFIEWPQKIPLLLPEKYLKIEIKITSHTGREINIIHHGR
ncbi:MAG: tRNA (adenosine(37)-N6)-threonylcarbamoyltransferase complex ATPase subunit type 1 TsaE, partial [Cyclobacteriaceae bacterium]|nr:tRNA (adenosine(37)-N6)-threonylcarbamoyltransferase complex ATPase subunit type 1 TsaE [Cyclobacteriaceae bacterium]